VNVGCKLLTESSYQLLMCYTTFNAQSCQNGNVGLQLRSSAPYWPNPWFLADRTIGRAFGTVSRLSVCDVLYCGKTVRPSQKLSEGVNRKK